MSESSSTTSHRKVLTLNVPVPDGLTTEGTFTVSVTLSSETSHSSAKTSALWTYLDGWVNLNGSVKQMEVDSVQWSISDEALQTPKPNTRLSHCGCWCHS